MGTEEKTLLNHTNQLQMKDLTGWKMYFLDWKSSIVNCAGNFTVNAQSKMFISWPTYEGLQIK